jgi:acyl dehydratase
MRKFANALVDTETKDAKGELVFTSTASILFRGEGGFAGQPPPKEESGIEVPKDKAPDFSIEEVTSKEQALLYRLSGDHNPLHADPEFATMVGFPQGPILHGLCTYGHMVRHVAKGACGGDATKITGFDAQFRKPVWPGDTIVTNGWKVAPGKVALVVKVKERDETVISNAWATVAV